MLKLASECDCEPVVLRFQIGGRTVHRPADRKVAVAIGKLHELRQDDARRAERHVDVPYRTGTAILGEMEGGGVEPLGDVAGLVNTQKEERNALRASALQCRQAVAGLLE